MPRQVQRGDIAEMIRDSAMITNDILITRTGIPIFMFELSPDDNNEPTYDMIEERCTDFTYKNFGQAFMVTDILAKKGFCSFKNASAMKRLITENLRQSKYIVLAKK